MFVLGAIHAIAGSTGKIAGRVVDVQTKEPLIGANVLVVGTTLGAATDLEGYFTILNVPPGTYTLRATFVGYSAREYHNARVSIDHTTTVNIELAPALIEVDPVVVVGTRLIQRDATATATTFDAKSFEALPVETLRDALQIQAGVTVGAGGDIHIRGGRANEILFLVDGVPLNNALTNMMSTRLVSTNAIQELAVVSGAFNAEYGNAQSGIVNIATKEGSKNFTGRLSFQTGDVVGGDDSRFLNIKEFRPFNTRETEMTLAGPIRFLGDGLSFMLSSRYYDDAGYLYGQRVVTYASDTLDNLVLGNREYVSMNPDRVLNAQAKLTYGGPSLKLSFSYLRKDRKYQVYSHAYRLAPDWRPVYYDKSDTYTLNTTLFLTQRTVASGALSYSSSKDESRSFENILDPRYKFRWRNLAYIANRNNPRGDSLAAILQRDFGLTVSELVRFAIGPSLDRTLRTGKKYFGRFDVTTQIGNVHLVKMGISGTLYDVYRDGLSLVHKGSRPDNDFRINNEVLEIPDANTRSRNIYRGKPYELAAYIQDKMEFPQFVLNLGLRFDYYNPNTDVPVDFYKLDDTPLTRTKPKMKLSPRFSFAHSVTDRSKIFFSYGHFFQLPPYANLFTGQEAFTNPLVEIRTGILSPVGGDRAVGNPDLKPQTTVSYEIGYEQELTEDVAFYLKGYYRNIRNLLATDIGFLSNGAVYAFYTNRDYGNVRGINLTLRKRFSNSYAFTIDYTYQVAEGNASEPTQMYLNYRAQAQEQKQVVYLDWDQPHTLRWSLDISRGGWQAGIIGRLESGYPYTPAIGSAIQGGQRASEENSGRKPPIFNVDFNLSKEFRIKLIGATIYQGVYAKVYNAFDTRNELFVFPNSGRATFASDPALVGFVQFPLRPDYFSKPREIVLGTYIRF